MRRLRVINSPIEILSMLTGYFRSMRETTPVKNLLAKGVERSAKQAGV